VLWAGRRAGKMALYLLLEDVEDCIIPEKAKKKKNGPDEALGGRYESR